MTVLDDLEAARQAWADTGEDYDGCAAGEFGDLAYDHLPALLAVCRAAVAYREAEKAYRTSLQPTKKEFDALMQAKQALLAATEGLT